MFIVCGWLLLLISVSPSHSRGYCFQAVFRAKCCSRHNEYSKKIWHTQWNHSIKINKNMWPNFTTEFFHFVGASSVLIHCVAFSLWRSYSCHMRGLYMEYFVLFIIWCDNINVYSMTIIPHDDEENILIISENWCTIDLNAFIHGMIIITTHQEFDG